MRLEIIWTVNYPMNEDKLTSEQRKEFQNWAKGKKMPNSEKNDFRTPQAVFDALNERFGPFTLDAAASEDNALVENFFDQQANSLEQTWSGKVWCNPPYVKQEDKTTIKDWVEKAWMSVKSGIAECVLLLIPAHISNYYWHDTIYPHASHLVLFRGRMNFEGPYIRAGGAARHPSVGAVFTRAWNGVGIQLLRMSNKGEWLTEENYNRAELELKLKNGVTAFGKKLDDNQFVVLEGSTANMKVRPSSRASDLRLRYELVKDGTLVLDDDKLRFTRDTTFTSPSAAATTVRACRSNGQVLWKLTA